MKKIVLLLSLLPFLWSCTANKASLGAEEEAQFSLQKTACMGTCPVYTLRISKDGRASLHAEKFMEREGMYYAQFEKSEIKELAAAFEEAGFSTFEDRYTSSRSDLPTTYISFNGKQIMDYDQAPKALKALEKKLEAFVERPEWKKAKVKK